MLRRAGARLVQIPGLAPRVTTRARAPDPTLGEPRAEEVPVIQVSCFCGLQPLHISCYGVDVVCLSEVNRTAFIELLQLNFVPQLLRLRGIQLGNRLR